MSSNLLPVSYLNGKEQRTAITSRWRYCVSPEKSTWRRIVGGCAAGIARNVLLEKFFKIWLLKMNSIGLSCRMKVLVYADKYLNKSVYIIFLVFALNCLLLSFDIIQHTKS